MQLVAVVTALALIEYVVMGVLVGRARGRYGVAAPATTGHPIFERYFRVHQNTLEQLVTFLPALWLFAEYVNSTVAAVLGLVFVVARAMYARGYVADPNQRETGALLTALTTGVLLLGGLIGAIMGMGRH
jgi:glutathione S-transferase